MCVRRAHPDKEGLVSQPVASLGEVLNGHPVGAVAGRVVHVLLLQGTKEHREAVVFMASAPILDLWLPLLHQVPNINTRYSQSK